MLVVIHFCVFTMFNSVMIAVLAMDFLVASQKEFPLNVMRKTATTPSFLETPLIERKRCCSRRVNKEP